MKLFAQELIGFLRRHYPEASQDGCYRFSADIQISNGEVEVQIPILTRLPDVTLPYASGAKLKIDPLVQHLPREGTE